MTYHPSALITIYLLILLGYVFTRGFYTFGAWVMLLSSLIILTVYWIKPRLFSSIEKIPLEAILGLTLLISLLLSLFLYGGLYQNQGSLFTASQYLLAFASFLGITYLASIPKSWQFLVRMRFPLLAAIAILVQILMILSSPNPAIDVFGQLKYGSLGLLSGQNSYSALFPQVYPDLVADYFPYLPLTALIVLPFNLLLSDPRWTLIAANLLVALILRKMLTGSKNHPSYEIIPLIYLFHPQATFMIEQAWIDPVVLALFCLFVWLLKYQKRKLLAMVSLGLGIGLKQQFPLILLFLLLFKKIPRFVILGAALIVVASIIPFYLLNRADFLNDVIQIHIARRFWWHNSLTANSFFFSQFGTNLGFSLLASIWIVSFLVIHSRGIKNWVHLTLALSLWFFIFYFFNYQAYLNYYPLITGLILVATALAVSSKGEDKVEI